MLKILFFSLSSILTYIAIAPLIKSHRWWIRAFDFPRIQVLILTTTWIAGSFLLEIEDESLLLSIVFFRLVLFVSILHDLYSILPYSRCFSKEVKGIKTYKPDQMIRVLSANVFIKNKNFKKVLELIKEKSPDIVLLLEADKHWKNNCQSLKKKFPHFIEKPQDNTYGMLLYSKLPITSFDFKNSIDPEVPALYAKLKTKSLDNVDSLVEFIGLHPRPPRPQDGSSKQRDQTLSMASKFIRSLDLKTPAIVAGDFNDVAWSHSSRRFLRESRLRDPRRGRGLFNTFPVNLPALRFPLDHIFHTKHFQVSRLEVCRDIGSDHYPMFAELQFE